MEDNLDNELKDRIREVFDNYDDASADAGWELLRQRFPEKKKRRIVPLWWYSAAAVLLLALGLWIFYPQTAGKQQVASGLPQKAGNQPYQQPATNALKPDTGAHQNQLAATNPTTPAGEQAEHHSALTSAGAQSTRQTAHGKRHPLKPEAVNAQQQFVASEEAERKQLKKGHTRKDAEQYAAETNTTLAAADNTGKRNAPNMGISTYKSPAGKNGQPGESSVEKAAQGQVIANNSTEKTKPEKADSVNSSAPNQVAQQPPQNASSTEEGRTKALLRIMADDKTKQLAADKTKTNETVKRQKAVALSVYAATYFNYAKGSTSDLNVGAGFTSDFSLNKNIKLSTGIAIAQNTLRYENSNDVPAQINNKLADVVNSHANAAAYSTAALKTYPAPLPAVKSSNANLVGLDIPINIKFDFNPKKSEAYIMAGISSGTYINETYRSSYSYQYNNAGTYTFALAQVSNEAQPTLESTTKQHFSTFDFAKTLNVSFGVGYPLGKYSLIVEPFLKYPLSGLGSQDIRFGAGGVNLKFNFRSIKK